jgi:flagellar protein FlaI
MGWFDWLKGTPPPAAAPAPPPKVAPAQPFRGTPGVTISAGSGGNGSYTLDDTVLAGGSVAVLTHVLSDELLEEVMHNGSDRPLAVFHRSFGMCDVNHSLDPATVERYIRQLATQNDRPLDADHPFLDGSLSDGSRVNISIPPVSGKWPNFTIRKFRATTITVPDIIRGGGLTAPAAGFLWCAIEGFGFHAANVMVVGGTGSGKTTLLNALTWFAPMHHRIVVIEDTRELRIPQSNVLRMATTEATTMDHLLVNALRQRPDRIIVGEVRGPEARTLFTAMNTGHDGCMGTLHANTARESMMRITTAPMAVPLMQVSALDLVVVQQRKTTEQGARRFCYEITEVSGVGGDTARLNQLFAWNEFNRTLAPTDVPSRLRTKICHAGGLSAAQFNDRLKRRTAILADLASREASEQDVLAAIAAEHARRD